MKSHVSDWIIFNKDDKLKYQEYWTERTKIMRKYVAGKVPRGAKKLFKIEKDTVVGEMLKQRHYRTIQQILDHDIQVLESRE